ASDRSATAPIRAASPPAIPAGNCDRLMSTAGAYFRLARAGWIMVREGVVAALPGEHLSGMAWIGWRLARLLQRGRVAGRNRTDRLAAAIDRLGPSYVKLGQFLATRPDVVGKEIAADLASLQDSMRQFP